MSEAIVSRTGYGRGWGSDLWKSVHGLTADERAAVRGGRLVAIRDCPRSGGNHGTTYRVVVASRDRFTHRLPDAEQLRAIEAADEREATASAQASRRIDQ